MQKKKKITFFLGADFKGLKKSIEKLLSINKNRLMTVFLV